MVAASAAVTVLAARRGMLGQGRGLKLGPEPGLGMGTGTGDGTWIEDLGMGAEQVPDPNLDLGPRVTSPREAKNTIVLRL